MDEIAKPIKCWRKKLGCNKKMQWVCSWTFRLDFPFHVVFSCNNVKAIKHGLSAFRLVVVGQKGQCKRVPFKCPKCQCHSCNWSKIAWNDVRTVSWISGFKISGYSISHVWGLHVHFDCNFSAFFALIEMTDRYPCFWSSMFL